MNGPSGIEYTTDLAEALEWFRDEWGNYEHLGGIPPTKTGAKRALPIAPKSAGLAVDASASRGASDNPEGVAAAMAGKSSSFVHKWMIDSGCG